MSLNRGSLLLSISLTFLASFVFAQDKYFDANGVRIHYVEEGSGPVVVLIHGQGGSVGTWLATGVLSKLAQDFRVIAIDARGHGKSGKPHHPKAYGREMSADAVRVMDFLGIQRAHFVGYSMGAHLLAQLLVTNPDRIITATLVGAAGRFLYTAEHAASDEREASERERECVSRSQIYRLAPTNAPKPDEDAILKLSVACMANPNNDRFALAALVRSKKDHVITPEQAAGVKVPTLGIVGSLDGYLKDFQALKRLRPEMRLVVIDGATHFGPTGVTRRAEFLAAVREFIVAH